MPADPFDIKLTIDPAGTPSEIGIMLVKPKDQPKQYQITEVDEGGEVVWVQADFRGGMVDERVQASGTNQYSHAYNFLADYRTGHLVSGPDYKEASTVASASLSGFPGCGHESATLMTSPNMFLRNDGDIYKSDAYGTTFTLSKDLAAGKTAASVASWKGLALIGCGSADKYWYSAAGSDGAAWTQSTLATGGYQDFFIPASDVIWGLLNPNVMRWSSDPTNTGSWSGAMYVGEEGGNDNFVAGFFISQILVIVKTMGVSIVDDGGNVEKVVNLRGLRGAVTDWTSKVYILDWGSEVWEYDIFQGTLRNLGFHTAVAGHLVIGGLLNVGGIERSFDKLFVTSPKGLWQWSQFRTQEGNLIAEAWESLYYDAALADLNSVLSTHRLSDAATFNSYPVYIGGSATATKMGYVRARRQRDLSDATNLTYTTVDSVVKSGMIDHGLPYERKIWQYAELILAGASINARLAYSIDGGSFTDLGAAAITTSGKTTLEFPSGTEGYTLQLRLTNDPAANTHWCALQSWSVRGTRNQAFRRRVQIAARIADGIVLRNGSSHPLKGDTIRSRLQAARTTASRLQLQDFMGNDFDVTILPPLVEVPSRDEHASDTESEIQFVAVENGITTAT